MWHTKFIVFRKKREREGYFLHADYDKLFLNTAMRLYSKILDIFTIKIIINCEHVKFYLIIMSF